MASSSSSSFIQIPLLSSDLKYSTNRVNPPGNMNLRRPKIVAAATAEPRTTSRPLRFTETASNLSSLYEVLGVSTSASCHEIKAAYRRLARTCHPDVVVGDSMKEWSANEFMKIHAAYSKLSDPEKRASYDMEMVYNMPRRRPGYDMSSIRSRASSMSSATTSGVSGFSSYHTCRNWETDQCW